MPNVRRLSGNARCLTSYDRKYSMLAHRWLSHSLLPFALFLLCAISLPRTLTAQRPGVPLTTAEAKQIKTFSEQLFAELEDAALRSPRALTFWTDADCIGAYGIIDGRFCEVYISKGESGFHLWMRITSSPNQEFPVRRISVRQEPGENHAILEGGLYLQPGPPLRLSQDKLLEVLRDAEVIWRQKLEDKAYLVASED